MGVKILFIVPYPVNQSPSQRFRFEQYFSILSNSGYTFSVESFLDSQNWQLFFKPGNHGKKILALTKGFTKRILLLFNLRQYDFIFIHREASPAGPPLWEWLAGKVLKKRIIYDFDDAIWMTDRIGEPYLVRAIKWRTKVRAICRWSYKISVGNNYLASFANQHNRAVIINPTTIDLNYHQIKNLADGISNKEVIIGWTGSHSTIKYLTALEGVLQRIEKEFQAVQFMFIADKKPNLKLERLIYSPWAIHTEIEDLQQFDVGIMPLPEDEWSKGKCGFKILQYLSLGIPAVASPVGVNNEIIIDGKSGYLCSSNDSWYNALKTLIEDPGRRRSFGQAGKNFITQNYSVASNTDNFLSLFK
jgi:glycosyltransferase involved in cell wall biosynthesis